MTKYVIDASVAAKWVLPARGETYGVEALRLLNRYAAGEVSFVVPDLFWAEVGNLLWKATRQKRLTPEAAEEALSTLAERGFPTVSSRTLVESALVIASAFNRTVYDAIYVALATSTKAPLVTADEHLANALAAHFPVRWLGSL